MSTDSLLVRVRGLWADRAGVPVRFPPPGGVRVVVSPRSGLCPPQWVGVVLVGHAAIVTAPNPRLAGRLRAVLPTLPVRSLTDTARIGAALPVVGFGGPVTLHYVEQAQFRPVRYRFAVEVLPPAYPGLDAFLARQAEQDVGRSGLARATSVFVVQLEGSVVAAGGYRLLPGRVAALGALTTPRWRGFGLARTLVSAATSDALARRLLPQAVAVAGDARRILASLGFRELGARIDLRVAA